MHRLSQNLLICSLLAILLACAKQPVSEVVDMPTPMPPPAPPAPPVNNGQGKNYLALGDSYTIGQGVSEAERYPNQTRVLLGGEGIDFRAPHIIAVTGWTTAQLQSAIDAQQLADTFDIVTLLIGVNDQYQHLSIDGYRQRFQALLTKAISLAGNRSSRVIVLSIPDYSVTPFAQYSDRDRIRREIDAFNLVNREITLARGAQYLDITASTREAASDRSLLAADGLHPSGKEYAKWAQRLAPLIKAVL